MSTRRGNGSSLAENHNALIGEHRGLDGGGYGEGEAVTQDLPPSILTTARTPWEPEMDVEFPRMPKDKQKAVESSGYDKTCFIIKQCWPRLDKFTVVFTTEEGLLPHSMAVFYPTVYPAAVGPLWGCPERATCCVDSGHRSSSDRTDSSFCYICNAYPTRCRSD